MVAAQAEMADGIAEFRATMQVITNSCSLTRVQTLVREQRQLVELCDQGMWEWGISKLEYRCTCTSSVCCLYTCWIESVLVQPY